MDKLLTVVVPVYNTEQYLVKCLDSLVVPAFQNLLDVIVVIDGSPDHSAGIARGYGEEYPGTFRVIEKDNGGHGSCCNVGLQQARGKYIRFLDSDDWFDGEDFPRFLARLSETDADVVLTRTLKEYVYEDRREIDGLYDVEVNHVYDVESFDFGKMPVQLFSLAEGTYTTRILREYGLQFREKVCYDDTILYVAGLSGIKKILFLDLNVYHYFIGRPGQSMSQDIRKKRIKDILLQNKDMFAWGERYWNELSPGSLSFLCRILGDMLGWLYAMAWTLSYSESRKMLKDIDRHVSHHPLYGHLVKSKAIKLYEFFPFSIGYIAYYLKNRLFR